ncbi:MAG: hypothetical protein QW165_01900 [Candidatus Woesearchaeota archaeon]
METEKEFGEELKKSIPLYKIAATVITALLLFGIIFAIFTERGEKPAPAPTQPTAAPTLEPTVANTTQNITDNITIAPMPETNITPNITANETPNITPMPTATPALVNISWETVTVTFPNTLKRIPIGTTSHHYIDIRENDSTPITNGEQFKINIMIQDPQGRKSELKPNFESGKWLVTIITANTGNFTLFVNIACAEKKGYCHRFYDENKEVEFTTTFEIF